MNNINKSNRLLLLWVNNIELENNMLEITTLRNKESNMNLVLKLLYNNKYLNSNSLE